MKISDRVAFITILELWKTDNDPVDGFICQILSVVKASGDEHPDETGANSFVLFSGEFSIGSQPIQQQVKLFLRDTHYRRFYQEEARVLYRPAKHAKTILDMHKWQEL